MSEVEDARRQKKKVVSCDKWNGASVLCGPSLWGPRTGQGAKQAEIVRHERVEDRGLAPKFSKPSVVGSGCWKPERVCVAKKKRTGVGSPSALSRK